MYKPVQLIIVILLFFLSLDAYAQKVKINGIYYPDEKVIIDSGNVSLLKQTGDNTIQDSDPEIIKQDFLVNSFSGESRANKYRSNIASDSSGNVLTCWVDYRNGRKDLYAQFYNLNSNSIGKNILITDIPNDWNLWPSVAANKKGNFIVTWAQASSEIFAQRLYKDGSKIGDNFKVNSINGWNLNYPSAAIDKDGNFLIVWTSDNYSGQDSPTYSRLFNSSGDPQGPEKIISENKYSHISSSGPVRHVAVDQEGIYAAVWSALDNDVSKIILQLIDKFGNKIGNNLVVSDLNPVYESYFPSISATDSGYYFIAWNVDSSYSNKKTGGRILYKDGSLVSDQLLFGNNIYSFSIASNRKDKFILCWSENNYSSSQNIYGQLIGNNGNLLGSPQHIVYDTSKTDWLSSFEISDESLNSFYLTFDNYQNVYIQKFDTLFTTLTNGIQINDDIASSFQYDPEVCYNYLGQSLIIWEDERNGKIDIYGQVIDKDFNPIGNEIRINDIAASGYFKNKVVKSLSDGNFVVAFSGQEYGSGGISMQLISNKGIKLNGNKLIQIHGVGNINLGVSNDDEILLCWYNSYSEEVTIQRFDKKLRAADGQIRILKSFDNFKKKRMYISINNNLDILASWVYYNYDTNEYFGDYTAEVLNKLGENISGTFNINPNISKYTVVRSYLDDDGNCVFYWIENASLNIEMIYRGENSTILTSRFYANGPSNYPKVIKMKNQKLFFVWTSGSIVNGYYLNNYNYSHKEFAIHNFGDFDQIWMDIYNLNDMDVFNDKMIFVYESNKNGGTGYDIWCNVQKIDSIDFKKEIKRLAIYEDTMFPIFPNPFNNSTTIAYELKEPHNVKITIYDILGRKIDVLIDEFHDAGFNQINFNAEELSSGIYFCVFEAKTTSVQKIIVLK